MIPQDRNRRALLALAVFVPLILIYHFSSGDDVADPVVVGIEDIPGAERRLVKLREVAASVPGKEQIFAQARSEMLEREKGLIQADTAPQAQAQLLQVLRKVTRAEKIDLRNTEMGQTKAYGKDYGEVAVAATFECSIEQLLNLLAALTAQKEAIGTSDVRIGTANPKHKTIPVRLVVSALVRRELVPDRKGAASF
jgi:hypothetical protein